MWEGGKRKTAIEAAMDNFRLVANEIVSGGSAHSICVKDKEIADDRARCW